MPLLSIRIDDTISDTPPQNSKTFETNDEAILISMVDEHGKQEIECDSKQQHMNELELNACEE